MWSKSTALSKSFKSHGNKVIQNLNSDFESHETGCTCTIFWRNAFVDELSNPLWTKKTYPEEGFRCKMQGHLEKKKCELNMNIENEIWFSEDLEAICYYLTPLLVPGCPLGKFFISKTLVRPHTFGCDLQRPSGELSNLLVDRIPHLAAGVWVKSWKGVWSRVGEKRFFPPNWKRIIAKVGDATIALYKVF